MRDIQAPDRSNIGAVIITYHPDREFPDRAAAVADQVARLLIVDNNSDPQEVDMLVRIGERDNVDLLLNDANLGVATALNQGLSWSREHGCEWLLTMDQDSRLFEGAISKFRGVFQDLDDHDGIAVIGSTFIDRFSGKPSYRHSAADGRSWEETITTITSGSLMSMHLSEVIGPFRDDLFIDLVDDEYCLRARLKGFRCVRLREPVFEHVIGNPQARVFLWRNKRLANAPPMRLYYQTRNVVVIVREYRASHPDWVKKTVRGRRKMLRKILLYESNKARKLLAVCRGLFDGLRGKMGPLP